MKKILSKILEEINKESPRLDYIRGLIEASLEEEVVPFQNRDEEAKAILDNGFKTSYTPPVMDEASIMEAETKAFIAKNGMPKTEVE